MIINKSADPSRDLTTARAFPLSGVGVSATVMTDQIATEKRRRERVVMDRGLARKLGLPRRGQVIINVGGVFAVYNAEQFFDFAEEMSVTIGVEGLARLHGVSLPTTCTLEAFTLSTGVTEAEAEAGGLMYETIADNGSQADFLAIAPHAGDIEPFTHLMAERFYSQMINVHSKSCSYWHAKGYSDDVQQTASERWHVTSVDMYTPQWPMLHTLVDRDFSYGISFHGYSSNTIEIGGSASNAFLTSIKAAIEAVVPGTITVNVTSVGEIEGASTRNILNRLCATTQHTVQLELSYEAREDYRDAIVDAIAPVYAALMP
jgi:phage replication-related protein YjqB (UPF0714/DUF867 family)